MNSEFVLDTHALIWHLATPKRLGPGARKVLEQIESGEATGIVPAVVLAECSMVAEKGRVEQFAPAGFERAVEVMQDSRNYRLSELTPELVLQSAGLEIPDIFDRLIVTETMSRESVLVTKDPLIHDSGLVDVLWA